MSEILINGARGAPFTYDHFGGVGVVVHDFLLKVYVQFYRVFSSVERRERERGARVLHFVHVFLTNSKSLVAGANKIWASRRIKKNIIANLW